MIAIIPTADRGKATVKVRVALKEKDPRIVPDMGVTVSFLERAAEAGEDAPRGVRVPAAAVATRDGSQVAFVVGAEDRVELRTISTGGGTVAGGQRSVLSGIAPGETVVLDPPADLADGDPIKVAE